jgi:hypothetical protein
MTIRKQAGAVILSTLAAAMMGGLPLAAQEPAAPKTAPAATQKQERVRPVPTYFGQIGLTAQQRAGIHEIQSKRRDKIDALEKQIAEEKAAMLADCVGVLTDVQKKLLENLRTAAVAARNTPKPADAPKTSN